MDPKVMADLLADQYSSMFSVPRTGFVVNTTSAIGEGMPHNSDQPIPVEATSLTAETSQWVLSPMGDPLATEMRQPANCSHFMFPAN